MEASGRVCFFASEVGLNPGNERARWDVVFGYIDSDPDPDAEVTPTSSVS